MENGFIERAQELLKDAVKEETKRRSENQWCKKNPIEHKKARKRYERTPKGKATCSISQVRNRYSDIELNLSYKERHAIGEFYLNCPPGYDVDHVIPLSRGGKHELSNLQYLTRSENMSKGNRTMDEHIQRKDLIKRNLTEFQTDLENISSKQMLQLTTDELRIFLPFLLKKIYDRSSINASNSQKLVQRLF